MSLTSKSHPSSQSLKNASNDKMPRQPSSHSDTKTPLSSVSVPPPSPDKALVTKAIASGQDKAMTEIKPAEEEEPMLKHDASRLVLMP